MTKEFDDRIAALDVEIATTETRLTELAQLRERIISDRSQALASGRTTTGDHIRDLVLRVHTKPPAGLEERLRTLETKLSGKKGELVLFTFERRMVSMSRRGGPLPGESYDHYSDVWFLACGVLVDDKLRIEDETIVLPIDKYAISVYETVLRTQIKFALEENPFTRDRVFKEKPLTYAIDAYATPEIDRYRQLRLVAGDAEVRAFLEKIPCEHSVSHLQQCCELLGKLILEPTDE